MKKIVKDNIAFDREEDMRKSLDVELTELQKIQSKIDNRDEWSFEGESHKTSELWDILAEKYPQLITLQEIFKFSEEYAISKIWANRNEYRDTIQLVFYFYQSCSAWFTPDVCKFLEDNSVSMQVSGTSRGYKFNISIKV